MKIITKFDYDFEKTLDIKSSEDWTFVLYVSEGTDSYPDNAWYEDGARTVYGWVYEFNRFQREEGEGGSGDLNFWSMPYGLVYRREGECLIFYPEDRGKVEDRVFASVDIQDFAAMLNETAQTITDYWRRHFPDLEPLNIGKVC